MNSPAAFLELIGITELVSKEANAIFIKDFFNYHVDLNDIRILNPYNINNYETEIADRQEPASDATVASGNGDLTIDRKDIGGGASAVANSESDVATEMRLREIIHDVRLAVVDTADLIIEMQLTTQAHFLQRVMLYVAEAYSANYARKAGTGVHYESLKPVWSINIVDFDPTARIKPTTTANANTDVNGAAAFDESLLFYELKDQYNRPLQPELFKVVFF